jgi:radical SAM superfamily enzyme YgiQ (UPF0313 family)
MKIQFIHPPIDGEAYKGFSLKRWRAPPTGLEMLAKSAEFSGVPKQNLSILDGIMLPMEEILPKVGVDADLVCISSWYSSALNARELAKAAKARGAYVAFGGPDVWYTAQRIIDNNPFIDLVNIGKGVSAMPEIIRRAEAYHKNPSERVRGVIKGSDFSMPFAEAMLFDLEHLDWRLYDPKTTQIPIDGITGCLKAERMGRCDYCSMSDRLKIRDVTRVWEQVALINAMYGFDYFFETGDSFMVGNYAQRLLDARPKGLENIRWRIYASSHDITPENIELFKKLNIAQLFIGIESFDPNVLAKNNRENTVEDVGRAVDLAVGGPWDLHLSMIWGLPGETEESMKKNYDLIRRTKERHGERVFVVSGPAIPIAGSKLFRRLEDDANVASEYPGLRQADTFDYEKLVEIQTRMFTSVNYKMIQEYIQKTRELIGVDWAAGFGATRYKR